MKVCEQLSLCIQGRQQKFGWECSWYLFSESPTMSRNQLTLASFCTISCSHEAVQCIWRATRAYRPPPTPSATTSRHPEVCRDSRLRTPSSRTSTSSVDPSSAFPASTCVTPRPAQSEGNKYWDQNKWSKHNPPAPMPSQPILCQAPSVGSFCFQ